MDEGSKNGSEDLPNTCWVSSTPTLEPLPPREGPSEFLALKFFQNFPIRDALNHLRQLPPAGPAQYRRLSLQSGLQLAAYGGQTQLIQFLLETHHRIPFRYGG